MKHLLKFTLKRRFLNKMMLYFLAIISVLTLLGVFVDKVVLFFNPSIGETITINLMNMDQQLFVETSTYGYQFDEFARIRLEQRQEDFIITSPDQVDDLVLQQLQESIHQYHYQHQFNQLESDEQAKFFNIQTVNIIEDFERVDDSSQKHHLAFYGITSIYFMMIGFASMIAQEIIAEKKANILELIGTSVSLKVHYYSKILSGWLSVLMQIGLIGSIVGLGLLLRMAFDNGVGWLQFMKDIGLLMSPLSSFSEVFTLLQGQGFLFIKVFLSLIYLFIGILTLQIFLVRLVLRVDTVEEAGAIQSPVYIVLLLLYYGAMLLNNPSSMQGGLALVLSFFPFFSMIFMPARILMYPVGFVQIFFSLLLSVGFFVFLLLSTERFYRAHILEGFHR